MAHIATFEFPIKDLGGMTQMHIIPPSPLPNFHGLKNEDPDTLLFEFEVFCRGYDYFTNDRILKVFPLTLKGAALWWFMNLGGHEEHILEEVPRLLQIQWRYFRYNTRGRWKLGGLCGAISIQPSKIKA